MRRVLRKGINMAAESGPNSSSQKPFATSDSDLALLGQNTNHQRYSDIFGLSNAGAYTGGSSVERARLESEIGDLRRELDNRKAQLTQANAESAEHRRLAKEYAERVSSFEKKIELEYITRRIRNEAVDIVVSDEDLRRRFEAAQECEAFVVSMDIRRSTSLMLKARTPQLFAAFLNELCSRLTTIVLQNNGVFDKFTGDGVLAFFPCFYSGEDAGYYALNAAFESHRAFGDIYKRHRIAFTSILADVGLGVGMDFGKVTLVRNVDGLTVVGEPVVYACRFGGAPVGCTYLNAPAFDQIMARASAAISTNETTIDIKNEGKFVAFGAFPSGVRHTPLPPAWLTRKLSLEKATASPETSKRKRS